MIETQVWNKRYTNHHLHSIVLCALRRIWKASIGTKIIIKDGSSQQTSKPHLPFSLMITSFNPVVHSSLLDLVLGVKSTTQQLFLNIFTALVYSLLHCSTVCIGCSHDLKILSSCRKIIDNVQDIQAKNKLLSKSYYLSAVIKKGNSLVSHVGGCNLSIMQNRIPH